MRRRLFAAFALAGVLCGRPDATAAERPSLILITLDTTRADHVGRVEAGVPLTPNLDALARSGTRYARALTASPLTLPAHCSLMTGLDPPAHGVRDNGVSSLPRDMRTLAAVLSERGYETAAFVSSRVLDRRFGLDRGFSVYDDAMVAEQVGGQGYPERDAAAVTGTALAWVARRPPGSRPYFLWVHYYDPHAPYVPPGGRRDAPAARRYAGEIAYVDREIGRLLAGLPGRAAGGIVAAVGDHGEMLGEHGEKEHGIFVYRAALEVPLILSGPGVPADRSIPGTVGTRALASALLGLLGLSGESRPFGPGLPGLPGGAAAGSPVYSESFLPASAYGWSPLEAASDDRYRLIVAPRPELYDLEADPGEKVNLFGQRREEAARLGRFVGQTVRGARAAPAADAAEVAESLRSLGYLSGQSPGPGSIDPKDGIVLLDEFDLAKDLLRQKRHREAAAKLEELVARSPGNVPFLTRLGEAKAAAGNPEEGIAAYRRAVELSPRLDFLHEHLARLYAELGRTAQARASYRAALDLNPRFAPAWLGLAQIASKTGPAGEELRILRQAEASGANSAAVLARLSQIELPAGDLESARRHAEEAVRLAPEVAASWWVLGEVCEREGRAGEALEAFQKAVELGLEDPRALVKIGRLLIEAGQAEAARAYLRRAIAVGAGTASAEDARRLLGEGP